MRSALPARRRDKHDPRDPNNFARLPIKGYSADERIVYGTGHIAPAADLGIAIDRIFEDLRVAFVHLRSARNNCYQARADRSDAQPHQ